MNLKEKVILITGASRGIGLASARLFATKGSTILFTARSGDNFAKIEDELKGLGAYDARGYTFDIRNYSESLGLTDFIRKDYNKIDILVNNAGIGIYKSIYQLTVGEWDDVILTNLSGVFYLTKGVLPLMREGGGHIVNVGSLASKNSFASGSAYCASKFGLLGLSECIMLDVRKDNIKVSIIMPGSVNTSFANRGEDNDEDTWKLTATDVAEAIYDVVNTRSGHLMSRVELRTLDPSNKK